MMPIISYGNRIPAVGSSVDEGIAVADGVAVVSAITTTSEVGVGDSVIATSVVIIAVGDASGEVESDADSVADCGSSPITTCCVGLTWTVG